MAKGDFYTLIHALIGRLDGLFLTLDFVRNRFLCSAMQSPIILLYAHMTEHSVDFIAQKITDRLYN